MRWRKVKRNSTYEVSDTGLVRSLGFEWKMPSGRIFKRAGKILKLRTDRRGYPVVGIAPISSVSVHRLVAEAFIKNPKGLPCVNHKDTVKVNNHFKNLEWCTNADNMKHAFKNGSYSRVGSKNGFSRLYEKDVRIIKTMLRKGDKHMAIAKRFNVSRMTISAINAGRNWSHVS